MIWYKGLFSFQGRLNRQGFWTGIAINFAFLFILVNFLPNPTAFNAIMLLPLAISLYSCLAIIVKRLHDRNRSGKNAFILCVPIACYLMAQSTTGDIAWLLGLLMPMLICTIVFLEWGFFRSYPQANQYGEQGLPFIFKEKIKTL